MPLVYCNHFPASDNQREDPFDFTMSSDTGSGALSAFEVALNDVYTNNYCLIIAAALFYYDVILTLNREVASFWTAKRTGASLLFFANKYISMSVIAMSLATLASFSSDERLVCSSFVRAVHAIEILQFVPWGIFSALRAWVLSKSRLFGLIVLVMSLAPAGANLVVYGYQLSGEVFVPPFGCIVFDTESAAIDLMFGSLFSQLLESRILIHGILIVVIVARVPPVLADVLLIYITWAKLGSRDALRGIRQHKRRSFSDILLRDGTIYFVVLFVLNVLHLAFSVTAVASEGQGSYLTVFTGPITATLVSRFLLELQEANRMVVRLDPDDPLHSSRNFSDDTSSFISSLGACINPGLTMSRDDDYEPYAGARSDEEQEGGARVSQVAASSSPA
ncbi:hypothetical protein OH76DRAFT_1489391 [Lentinus brumalis]|uniref:DUF6533 domain-containing protein n=1 Tax=Lentinus brumalis TaxID=2498619 RepID=A0A371CMR2_9APHY|nr:hypothetical protein OH76DRAFT_1489391 [Polyporus brumalis]